MEILKFGFWCVSLLLATPCFSTEVTRIPLHSFPLLSKQKFIQMHVQGRPLLALIDTGSPLSFIRQDLLTEIEDKQHVSNSECINMFGDSFFSSNFQIENVKLGDFSTEVVFKEEHPDFLLSVVTQNRLISWKTYLMYQVYREGIIGMDIFQKFACGFDFPHSSIFLAEEMSQIQEHENFTTAEFHSVPFEMGKSGAILLFETDLGTKKLILDAGCTFSAIRFTEEEKRDHAKISSVTTRLAMNGLDFGKRAFKVVDIYEKMDDIDGILGIKFFNENVICLDFARKIAHIQHPKLGSKERFNYWLKSYFGR